VTQINNYHVEQEVLTRYQKGAREKQPSLCCPTAYQEHYLDILPEEIIAKDYGCGDPTRHVNVGETVVDLGSGAGKNCYIIAQKVGASGKVIGVDFNDEMLSLARKYQGDISERLGYANTHFVKAKIQDLSLDLDLVSQWLESNPVTSVEKLGELEGMCDRLRRENPLIPTESVDVVVSNCVLNLVRPEDKQQLFQEIYRILSPGGRAVIADIVCDRSPTPAILNDPELWSGCIAGAFREDAFLEMFRDAGFYGIEILERQSDPWQVIDGIEFRSLTVRAFKGTTSTNAISQQRVIYRGPWQGVKDDHDNILPRGERVIVSQSTYEILTDVNGPYHQDIIAITDAVETNCNSSKCC